MKVTMEIELEKIAWIVSRAACLCRFRSLEVQLRYRQATDERVKNSTYMVCRDQIVQHYWKQRPLTPTLTLDIADEKPSPRGPLLTYACLKGGSVTDTKAPHVIIETDDIRAMEERVQQTGGTVTLSTFKFPGGSRFHFTDPSENELAVMQVE